MELFELFATLRLDDNGFAKGIRRAVSTVNSAGKAAFRAGQQITQTMTRAVLIGGTAMATGLTAFAKSAVDAAAQVAAENAQFEASFAGIEEAALKAYSAIGKETNVLTSRLKATGTKGFSQFKGAGLEANEALDASSRLLQLAADGAAYYDMSLEAADERLRSFIRGNTEAGDAIGLFTSESQRNSRAMEVYKKKYTDLTEAQKQLLMLDIAEEIYRQSGATGQAAREGHEYANVMANLSESYRQLKAALGEPIKNAMIPVVESITASLDGFKVAYEQSGIKGLADAVGGSLDDVIEIIRTKGPGAIASGFEIGNYILTGLNERLPAMIGAGEEIFESVRTGFSTTVPLIADAARELAPAILGGVISFKGDMLAAGIEILGGIAEGITDNKEEITAAAGEAVRKVLTAVTENLPSIITGGLDLILALAQGIEENTGELERAISTAVSSLTTWLMEPGNLAGLLQAGLRIALSVAKGIIGGIVDGISREEEQVTDAVDEAVSKSPDGIADNLSDLVSGGMDMVTSIVTGIADNADGIERTISDTITGLGTWFEKEGNLSTLVIAGGKIAGALIKGIANGLKNLAVDVGIAVGDETLKVFDAIFGTNLSLRSKLASEVGPGQADAAAKLWMDTSKMPSLKPVSFGPSNVITPTNPAQYIPIPGSNIGGLKDYEEALAKVKTSANETSEAVEALKKTLDDGTTGQVWKTTDEAAKAAKTSIDQANDSVKQFLSNNGKTISLGATISISQSGSIRGGGGGRGAMDIALASHATGLNYVPMNNYVARLHRGEMVLTAQEAADYRARRNDRGGQGVTVVQNIQAVPMTPRELAFQTANALETLRFGL